MLPETKLKTWLLGIKWMCESLRLSVRIFDIVKSISETAIFFSILFEKKDGDEGLMINKRTSILKSILLTALILGASGFVFAQGMDEAKKSYKADMKDVESVDAIIDATYDSISGGVGEARNWDRFLSLFHKDAKLIPTGENRQGEFTATYLTPQGYIARAGKFLLDSGFRESEISRKTDKFGNIAQVFSTYEGKMTVDGKQQTIRGINSFQLMFDGKRWWVIDIFWQQESPKAPIPKDYLPKK